MKRTKLFKSLLVAAGLLVGASAWADDVASHNFNGQTTPFTISDANRLSVSYPAYVEGGNDYYAKYTCGNMNGVAFAYYDFSSSVSDAATVTVDFDFYITAVAGHALLSIADASAHTASGAGFTSKSNTGYGATGAIFNLGCFRGGGNNKFAINSEQNNLEGLGEWCHATVTVDNATKTVNYTITKNGATLATAENVAFLNSSATRCSQVDLYIGTNASDNAIQLDNIVITKTVSDASHNYTINAVAGGTVLEELASGIANENAGFSVSAPRVILKDNVYYVMDLGQANMSGFLAEYTMGTEDVTKQITYTADPSVIYFKECEDIQQKNELATASSGYTCGYYATPQIVTISEAGWYQLETNITGRDSNSSLEVYTEDGTESVAAFAKNCGTGIKTLDFEATGNMRIGGPYYNDKFNNSKSVDYILVRKYSNYTAKFFNSKKWDNVYAYTYPGDAMGGWPGTQLTAENGLYNVSFRAVSTPEHIIFNNGNSGTENQTDDLDFVDGAAYYFGGQGNIYTATFTTNKGWSPVYAYAWSGADASKVEQLGGWPGTAISGTGNTYSLTFVASAEPEYIIFNGNSDDKKTGDLAFENGMTYSLNSSYVVAGSAALFGTDFNTTDENNKLDEINNTLTFTEKELAVGLYQYKVVMDGSWDTSYPASDKEIDIKLAGKYDIVITFDPVTKAVDHTMAVYKGISGAGYATFCAPYDLNFEGSGITAYIAKKDDSNNVTFEQVFSAPAETGLLLKADEDTYKLKMEISSQDCSDNILVGTLESKDIPAYSFVLMKGDWDGGKGVGFYQTTKAFNVSANTAYIEKLDDSASGDSRTFIGLNFDDMTTDSQGIEGVAAVKMQGNEIFNLQGQRVTNAKKGLYIINGKKMLVK